MSPEPASLATLLEPYRALGRSGLLPALQAVQRLYGWIPQDAAAEVAKTLKVPLAEVHGVITFYSLLYNEPVGRRRIYVCTDPVCAMQGGEDMLQRLCGQYGLAPGETTLDGEITVERSPCLGLCEHAPARVEVEREVWRVALNGHTYELPPVRVYGSVRVLTPRCGNGPTFLAEYGEYAALRKARNMAPEAVIAEVKASGLVGRGGAAFPTGLKWEAAAKAEGSPKYIVCNADESEPGTFKDRVLLQEDPHAVIEGMCIAAHAVGASKGYIYLRGEYAYLAPILEKALEEAREAGYLENFPIELRLGAGAYICGEETALFESIEGKRGFPRIKPPYPTTHGLFGKPTVINNVETFANIPVILREGADAYRRFGTAKSPGTKLFALSGDVVRPGVYEVPFGITLRELLDMAGGVRGELQAVLLGGAAGTFATSDHLGVPLTFEDLRAAGLTLGSGAVMVFNTTRDMRKILLGLAHFFAHESCGKCYPCQLGTQRQVEILERLAQGTPLPGDADRLRRVGLTMTEASLCGLGQTAASAVLSAMQLWPELFTANGAEG